MTDLVAALATAFLTGLLGSAHCLGMCGGISGLFALHSSVRGLRRQLPMALAYNAGRLASYAILGFAVAALGSRVVGLTPALGKPVRLVAGGIIILIGLQIAFNFRALNILERAGSTVWERISPLAGRLLPVNSLPRALGLGLLWGLLPCGLVYSVLLLAATTAEPTSGGLVMVAFGLGTMPAMIATGISASKLAQFMNGKRFGAGLLIVLLGLATIAMPVMKFTSSDEQMDHSQHGSMMQDD